MEARCASFVSLSLSVWFNMPPLRDNAANKKDGLYPQAALFSCRWGQRDQAFLSWKFFMNATRSSTPLTGKAL